MDFIYVKLQQGVGGVSEYSLNDGDTVEDLIRVSGASTDGKKVIVGDEEVELDYELEDGELVSIITKTAGGLV